MLHSSCNCEPPPRRVIACFQLFIVVRDHIKKPNIYARFLWAADHCLYQEEARTRCLVSKPGRLQCTHQHPRDLPRTAHRHRRKGLEPSAKVLSPEHVRHITYRKRQKVIDSGVSTSCGLDSAGGWDACPRIRFQVSPSRSVKVPLPVWNIFLLDSFRQMLRRFAITWGLQQLASTIR